MATAPLRSGFAETSSSRRDRRAIGQPRAREHVAAPVLRRFEAPEDLQSKGRQIDPVLKLVLRSSRLAAGDVPPLPVDLLPLHLVNLTGPLDQHEQELQRR